MHKRLISAIAIGLIAIIAALGYQLGQDVPTPSAESAIPPTSSPVAPGPLREAPTARMLPTLAPLAPQSDEPLPPLVLARQGQIWRSDGVGRLPRQLTTFDVGWTPSHPQVSPDGSLIAFVALIQPPITATLPLPSSRLYTMRADGSELREIWAPEEGILWLPSWAPDGTALYLFANGTPATAQAGGNERLVVLRIDLASRRRTAIVTGALDPTVARDGSRMAYLKFAADGITMHVEIADLDGHNPQMVIDGSLFQGFYAPRFTPDGRAIYVAAIGGPPTNQQGFPVSLPAGQGRVPWLENLLEPSSASAHGAPWDIWRVNLDGTGLQRVTFLNEDLPMVAFSPDGTQVALMAYGGIYLMSPDGSNIRRIDSAGDHGGLDWVRYSGAQDD